MKNRAFLCFLITIISISISGCLPLMVGGAVGALGGYAVSKDTIQGDSDEPYDNLWRSALDVSRIRGTIKYDDSRSGYIESVSDASSVWIRLTRLTRATTRIRVSCRKYHLPNIELAQDIFAKILEEAK